MTSATPTSENAADSLQVVGNTLWHYDEALRQFRSDLRLMESGELRTAYHLSEREGALAGMNHLTAYVSHLARIEICQLEEAIQASAYPALASSRVQARAARRGGDQALAEVLDCHALVARIFPDILGSRCGGTKDDYSQARCALIPQLIESVAVWLRRRDCGRSAELGRLAREWNSVTGWG